MEEEQGAFLLRRLEAVVGDKEYQGYLLACSDYILRRALIYRHWPQRRYHPGGYTDEKVFEDMNA